MRRTILLLVLAGCPTVDLGDQPAELPLCTPVKGYDYFVSDIWPKYINNTKKNCLDSMPGACHANTGGMMVLDPSGPTMDNFDKVRAELNCTLSTSSTFYEKPCGLTSHFGNMGGPIFNCPSDPEPTDFLAWFTP